ncbi:RHS repeat domain-containing protein [Riemerella anatipestifer]|uniref:RHS repeat domain-containing protein n=1 Tax=Riemerella anatipestifer TaxID=34085 RepID=UPI001372637A|nr:RHS repeat-associated core domain-containing protein [Riemerella anatipestifer]MDY3525982.1 RHS repeat-associated core domain-containing protein [Riemerella anatipestifer]NAV17093.1 RHS repeat-associated core domain-containing protein [Riemerella anatipestifer]
MHCQTVIKSKNKFRSFVGPTTETRRSDDGAVRSKKRLPKWQKGKFTKHYFEGTSRIVSKLGEGTFHQPTGLTAGGIDYIKQSAKIQEAIDQYIKGLNIPPGPPTQHGIYGTPDFTGQEYPSIDWSDISQDQEPPEGWPRPPKFNEPGDVPGPPVQYGDPVKPDNVKGGFGYVDNGIEEKNLYYYHPDHLGSSSYITDVNGDINQHTEYMAFGEVLFDEHKVSRRMPYLFNGKELDSETGLYYYGARYYDPRVSIFLNVDPLVEKTMQPYAFSNNNPVNFVDFDGNIPYPITIRAFAPFEEFGYGFHGDNRGFTTYQGVSSRMTNWIAFDTDKTNITTGGYSSPTYHTKFPNYKKTARPIAKFRDGLSITKRGDFKTFKFGTHAKAANPLTPPGTPDIDIFSDFTITENKKAGTLSIRGNLKGDNFPSTEAFITDPSGQAVFIGVGQIDAGVDKDNGPFTELPGEGSTKHITSFNFTITTDNKGNFTGVQQGKLKYSIEQWNKQFTSKPPQKTE